MRTTSAWLPIAMSAVALALIPLQAIFVGTARQPDEGTAARLWQLLMAGQLPVIGYFALAHVLPAPRRWLPILGAQLLAGLAAAAPVFILQL